MDGTLLIFICALMAYLPLAGVLFYIWWKYGKGEVGVSVARTIFIAGSFLIIFSMLFI